MKLDSQKYYLYILQCDNSQYYTGVTTHTQRRYREHVSGKSKAAKYTRGKKLLTLVYSVKLGSKSDAHRIEYYVKKLPRHRKQKIVNEQMKKEALVEYLKTHFQNSINQIGLINDARRIPIAKEDRR